MKHCLPHKNECHIFRSVVSYQFILTRYAVGFWWNLRNGVGVHTCAWKRHCGIRLL